MTFQILSERPDDAVLINPLLDRTFGFDRKQRTVYRLREGLLALPGLSFVSIDSDGALLGSIRYWPIRIGDTAAILLGPLAVEPALQGQGIGKALVGFSLEAARALDHRVCVVVGAPLYYRSLTSSMQRVPASSFPGRWTRRGSKWQPWCRGLWTRLKASSGEARRHLILKF